MYVCIYIYIERERDIDIDVETGRSQPGGLPGWIHRAWPSPTSCTGRAAPSSDRNLKTTYDKLHCQLS